MWVLGEVLHVQVGDLTLEKCFGGRRPVRCVLERMKATASTGSRPSLMPKGEFSPESRRSLQAGQFGADLDSRKLAAAFQAGARLRRVVAGCGVNETPFLVDFAIDVPLAFKIESNSPPSAG